ncbi:hypothetical protein H4R20_004320 [Coemansia guatemalensis]|uniref:GH18 domain-containing protein n=1 Tax=Coemansia guatemalensis TaxID=2761395 RepID=A0A9W8HS95_9FUNG|nr:hypothetical protein H4R20_004320 [Coemansia guatemalensis]
MALGDTLFVGYYNSWSKDLPEDVKLSKYSHINLAYILPKADGTFEYDTTFFTAERVKSIQAEGPKVLASVGGFDGSFKYSTLVADVTVTKEFITNLMFLVKALNLDGIDFNWENIGIKTGCYDVDLKHDAYNYLRFIQDVRLRFTKEFGEGKKMVTTALGIKPFLMDGESLDNVSEFAKVVDYGTIRAFDMNGAGIDSTGPNAPLPRKNALGSKESIEETIQNWIDAKWPVNKLVLGLPFYGSSAIVKGDVGSDEVGMYAQREAGVPKGDWMDREVSLTGCKDEKVFTGNWKYRNLRVSALTSPNEAQKDWKYFWDEGSQTPWLYNQGNMTFISYDNPESITAKVKHAAGLGLAGAMVWAVDMDFKEELVNAMQSWPKEKETPEDKSEPDDKCTVEFQNSCPDEDGKSATYSTCIGGVLISRLCPDGTVCYKNNDDIKCDYRS